MQTTVINMQLIAQPCPPSWQKPQFMNKYHLDSCTVKLGIPLAAHIERLKISEDVSGRFKVKVASSATGINISGQCLPSAFVVNDRPMAAKGGAEASPISGRMMVEWWD